MERSSGSSCSRRFNPFYQLEETLDEIRAQKCRSCRIRSAPTGRAPSKKMSWTRSSTILISSKVLTSRVTDDRDNAVAQGYAIQRWKPVSAGSDAHTSFELGRTYLSLEPFTDQSDSWNSSPEGIGTLSPHEPGDSYRNPAGEKPDRRMGLISSP